MKWAKTYEGVPCQQGHTTRYVNGRGCQQCMIARIASRRETAPRTPLTEAQKREAARRHSRAYRERRRTAGLPLKKGRPGVVPTRAEALLCECCGDLDPRGRLCLDHDHVTGAFRGWLCHKCNRAIGQLGDTLDGVMRAVKYLRRATGV